MTYVRRSFAAASLGVWLAFAPVPVAPVVYFAPITQAQAADFLLSAPSREALDAVAQTLPGLWVSTTTGDDGVVIPGHVGDVHALDGGGAWVMTKPFRWLVPTGETTTDELGNTVPMMAAKPGWFWVFRWNAPLAALAPYLTLGGGAMTTDPETGAITITAGPITMVSPMPDDTPVRY